MQDIISFSLVELEHNLQNLPTWAKRKSKDRQYGLAIEPFVAKFFESIGQKVERIDESIEQNRGKGDFIFYVDGMALIYDNKTSIIHQNSISISFHRDAQAKEFWDKKDGLICSYLDLQNHKIIIWGTPSIQEVEKQIKENSWNTKNGYWVFQNKEDKL
jgi:hypothetical protein